MEMKIELKRHCYESKTRNKTALKFYSPSSYKCMLLLTLMMMMMIIMMVKWILISK
jgi:hypothetical protein